MQLLGFIFWSCENFSANALGLGTEPPPPKQSCNWTKIFGPNPAQTQKCKPEPEFHLALHLDPLKAGVHCFSIQVVMNKCFLLNPEKNLTQIHLVVFEKTHL